MKFWFMKRIDVEFDTIYLYPHSSGKYVPSVRTDKTNSHGQYIHFKIQNNDEIDKTIQKLCQLLKDAICEGHYTE